MTTSIILEIAVTLDKISNVSHRPELISTYTDILKTIPEVNSSSLLNNHGISLHLFTETIAKLNICINESYYQSESERIEDFAKAIILMTALSMAYINR